MRTSTGETRRRECSSVIDKRRGLKTKPRLNEKKRNLRDFPNGVFYYISWMANHVMICFSLSSLHLFVMVYIVYLAVCFLFK
ncbi:uncharacterized protein EURHEDRAFT_67210 [Aspergillus ruber CBS 135680]|uniref:Uncharacterized protein n=1 Tax=Aspergillus ruber (strain CBS 135680) TaxID=1388766 RepID=A0A017SDY1_ASPRC|nr:uncharacterized protein EURHEDRAFT_67210 [Aspergillus ruber CBS 135680]EYE95147.1 hypothetical protein EURHEDRAFT_67210 [Aspergillus ruber CBS 135680]